VICLYRLDLSVGVLMIFDCRPSVLRGRLDARGLW